MRSLVAEFTTGVVYDRLGTGWSDTVDLPRSGTQVTDDPHELLLYPAGTFWSALTRWLVCTAPREAISR
ncbi:hypothetical protein [Rhodococcus sp. ACT016]|uniref:hypothetical protein n=1 Tax=Rhodococcus sp. ACT016 TaxID=3134808 RepID=UPI003D2A02D1